LNKKEPKAKTDEKNKEQSFEEHSRALKKLECEPLSVSFERLQRSVK
jgi:hypothetical protein